MKDKERPPILNVQHRIVETVGPWILRYLSGSTVQDKCLTNGEEVEDTNESFIDEETESDTIYLKTLDPKEWKDQDHYQVLGLSKLRYKATEAQIKVLIDVEFLIIIQIKEKSLVRKFKEMMIILHASLKHGKLLEIKLKGALMIQLILNLTTVFLPRKWQKNLTSFNYLDRYLFVIVCGQNKVLYHF
uniref:ACYPI002653 protein n=1 Tax=Acyrthosiphon pisum TaxID=7029 RepID=C4WXF1_ACYPI|nr:ACYPI002653 [Acyrthosiphon pisum]